MSASQRIVVNTVAIYGRSLFTALLMLFSSRWVLNALGQSDFGLFAINGSIIWFITIINTVLAVSVSRHFAYCIGQGASEEVANWFGAALALHLLLAIVLVVVGWPVGEYVVGHVLTIPSDRVASCLWVFRVSLISAFASMISVPFIAMFVARQRIVEPACWGILQAVLTFGLAYSLFGVSGDRLVFYAVGVAGIVVVVQCGQMFRAAVVFPECGLRLGRRLDTLRAGKIMSFAAWNLFGGLAGVLRDQGSAILLNICFGPRVNASYGVANMVSAQGNQLATSMLGAMSPEITSSEGRGDRDRMTSLSLRACRLGTLLVMLFAISLMVEMDYVLRLWLRQELPYAAIMCRLILGSFLIDRLTAGYMLAVTAHGRVAAYQATVGGVLILTLPLAYLFFRLQCPPSYIGVAFIVSMSACCLGRVWWARRLLAMPIRLWLRGVLVPCAVVGCVAAVAASVPSLVLPPSAMRLALTFGAALVVFVLMAWFFGLDARERDFFKRSLRQVSTRIRNMALAERA